MSVISNTTVLSNFAAIDSLHRLHDLFGEVFLPTEVYQEIQRGLEEGYAFYSGVEEVLHPKKEDGWLRLTSLNNEGEVLIFSGMPGQLHASGRWQRPMAGLRESSPPAFILPLQISQTW